MFAWQKTWNACEDRGLVSIDAIRGETWSDGFAYRQEAEVRAVFRLRDGDRWSLGDAAMVSYECGDDPLETTEADAVRKSCLAELKAAARARRIRRADEARTREIHRIQAAGLKALAS